MKAKKIICAVLSLSMALSLSVWAWAAEEESSETDISAPEITYSWGDLNGDNKITAQDARICLRAAAQLETLDKNQLYAADVFGTGEIISANARKILRVSANLDIFDDIKVQLGKGEQYTVYGLETSGAYTWQCSVSPGEGLEVTKTVYNDSEQDVDGNPVNQIFTFTGINAGEYTVNLKLVRPWISEDEPLREIQLTVTVK